MLPHDPLSKCHTPLIQLTVWRKTKQGTLFENTQMKACVCVWWGQRKVVRSMAHPARSAGIWRLKAALENITEDSCFQDRETETTGGGQWLGQTHTDPSGLPWCPELCPSPKHTAPLNLETRVFSFNIRPVNDWLCHVGQITLSSCIGIRFLKFLFSLAFSDPAVTFFSKPGPFLSFRHPLSVLAGLKNGLPLWDVSACVGNRPGAHPRRFTAWGFPLAVLWQGKWQAASIQNQTIVRWPGKGK